MDLQVGQQEDAAEVTRALLSQPVFEAVSGGQMSCETRCRVSGCGRVAHMAESFTSLPLAVPDGSDTLEDLLQEYLAPEEMSGGNVYKCVDCMEAGRSLVPATRQTSLTVVHSSLVIHVLRFDGTGRRKKDRHICFGPTLDLPCGRDQPSARLALRGIVVHQGDTTRNGHYFAYVTSGEGQWFRADDEVVTPVTQAEVMKAQAYMLFYERVQEDDPDAGPFNSAGTQSPSGKAPHAPPTGTSAATPPPAVPLQDKGQAAPAQEPAPAAKPGTCVPPVEKAVPKLKGAVETKKAGSRQQACTAPKGSGPQVKLITAAPAKLPHSAINTSRARNAKVPPADIVGKPAAAANNATIHSAAAVAEKVATEKAVVAELPASDKLVAVAKVKGAGALAPSAKVDGMMKEAIVKKKRQQGNHGKGTEATAAPAELLQPKPAPAASTVLTSAAPVRTTASVAVAGDKRHVEDEGDALAPAAKAARAPSSTGLLMASAPSATARGRPAAEAGKGAQPAEATIAQVGTMDQAKPVNKVKETGASAQAPCDKAHAPRPTHKTEVTATLCNPRHIELAAEKLTPPSAARPSAASASNSAPATFQVRAPSPAREAEVAPAPATAHLTKAAAKDKVPPPCTWPGASASPRVQSEHTTSHVRALRDNGLAKEWFDSLKGLLPDHVEARASSQEYDTISHATRVGEPAPHRLPGAVANSMAPHKLFSLGVALSQLPAESAAVCVSIIEQTAPRALCQSSQDVYVDELSDEALGPLQELVAAHKSRSGPGSTSVRAAAAGGGSLKPWMTLLAPPAQRQRKVGSAGPEGRKHNPDSSDGGDVYHNARSGSAAPDFGDKADDDLPGLHEAQVCAGAASDQQVTRLQDPGAKIVARNIKGESCWRDADAGLGEGRNAPFFAGGNWTFKLDAVPKGSVVELFRSFCALTSSGGLLSNERVADSDAEVHSCKGIMADKLVSLAVLVHIIRYTARSDERSQAATAAAAAAVESKQLAAAAEQRAAATAAAAVAALEAREAALARQQVELAEQLAELANQRKALAAEWAELGVEWAALAATRV